MYYLIIVCIPSSCLVSGSVLSESGLTRGCSDNNLDLYVVHVYKLDRERKHSYNFKIKGIDRRGERHAKITRKEKKRHGKRKSIYVIIII